jgi:hypothetical protein
MVAPVNESLARHVSQKACTGHAFIVGAVQSDVAGRQLTHERDPSGFPSARRQDRVGGVIHEYRQAA